MNLPPGFQVGQTQGFSGQQTYSNRTLIGGYSDEIALQDDRIRAYISTRDAGKGTVAQRLASRMRRHLQPIHITPQHPDGNVRFGDLVMLQNAVTQGYLSVDLDDKAAADKFGVTTASANTPLVRNVFRVERAQNPSIEKESRKFEARKEGDILHYGQKFRLSVPELDPDCALHLMTEFKTPSIFSRMSRQQQVAVTSGGAFELCWEMLHPDITKRRNLDGQPVKQNTVVVVKHCQTNQNLSSDKIGYTNSFGTEFEVCGHTALTRASKHGQEEPLPVNCWAVVTAPTGTHYENMLDASFKDSVSTLEKVKAKFLARAGNGGFRTLVRILKVMDDNGNRSLDQQELTQGLATYGIRLTEQEAKAVMREFDKDGSGQISITEFLRSLRAPLNHRRRTLVSEAYKRFDKNYDGTVNLKDLQEAYGKNIHRHPSVVSGEKTPDQVLLEFASAWDKNGDGTITLQEFLEYYTDVSVNIDDDDYFELMIRNAWHMSGGSGWSENTTCRRVLVVHTDGSQTIQEIKDDLGLDARDMEAIRRRLIAQGVRNIKEIQLTG